MRRGRKLKKVGAGLLILFLTLEVLTGVSLFRRRDETRHTLRWS